MRNFGISLVARLVLAGLFFAAGAGSARAQAQSEWVHRGAGSKLEYKATERGDKIMDFSHAGYMGGGVALPNVPAKVTVPPADKDATAAIQQAIDKVSAMPVNDGFRGAVMLSPTTYTLTSPLRIDASGVVLRGSGSGPGGTALKLTENAVHAVNVGTRVPDTRNPDKKVSVNVLDAYIPAGAISFNVADGKVFKAGDTIHIIRPATPAWISFMGMDQLERKGKKQTWIGKDYATERRVVAINGTKITLDVPLSDSYDGKYLSPPGVKVIKRNTPVQISQVGVENLRIVAPPQNVPMSQAKYAAFTTSRTLDGWVRDVACVDTVNSVEISTCSRRITLEAVNITHTVGTVGSARPVDYALDGSQTLLHRCNGNGENIFFVGTGPRVSGPIVVLNCTFSGRGSIQPHQRWATGILIDNCKVDRGIDFMNRGSMGTGQGWTVGWAVAWNCTANSYTSQMPPGAANWVIGSTGNRVQEPMPFKSEQKLTEGIFDSHGKPVEPKSLYLAQLEERLGPQAVKNIGY